MRRWRRRNIYSNLHSNGGGSDQHADERVECHPDCESDSNRRQSIGYINAADPNSRSKSNYEPNTHSNSHPITSRRVDIRDV